MVLFFGIAPVYCSKDKAVILGGTLKTFKIAKEAWEVYFFLPVLQHR